MANIVSAEIEDQQKDDIFIEYGIEHYGAIEKTLTYNVSYFLRNYRIKHGPDNEKIKKFIDTLDKRVSVDVNDSKYKPIMGDLNTIVDNISRKMSEMDKRCKDMKKILTGSIKAGVKVDLPFEVDFMLALTHEDGELSFFQFETLIDKVIKTPGILCKGWSINNVKLHRAGVTLAMECHGLLEPKGVFVDLIPVYFNETNAETSANWSKTAMSCIADYGIRDLSTFRLLMNNDNDTGLIEGDIVSLLSEGRKRAFRVTKYLLQTYIHSIKDDRFPNYHDRPGDYMEEVYGPKPHMKSYYLRILLLHLVFATHDHPHADELTDDCLVFCLLDILAKAQSTIKRTDHKLFFIHPIKSTYENIYASRNSFPFPSDSGKLYMGLSFDAIISSLFNDAKNEDLSNSKENKRFYFIEINKTEREGTKNKYNLSKFLRTHFSRPEKEVEALDAAVSNIDSTENKNERIVCDAEVIAQLVDIKYKTNLDVKRKLPLHQAICVTLNLILGNFYRRCNHNNYLQSRMRALLSYIVLEFFKQTSDCLIQEHFTASLFTVCWLELLESTETYPAYFSDIVKSLYAYKNTLYRSPHPKMPCLVCSGKVIQIPYMAGQTLTRKYIDYPVKQFLNEYYSVPEARNVKIKRFIGQIRSTKDHEHRDYHDTLRRLDRIMRRVCLKKGNLDADFWLLKQDPDYMEALRRLEEIMRRVCIKEGCQDTGFIVHSAWRKKFYIEVLYLQYAPFARKQDIIHSGMTQKSRYDTVFIIEGVIVHFRVTPCDDRYFRRLSDSAYKYKEDYNIHFPGDIKIYRADRFICLFINSDARFDSTSMALLNHMLEKYSEAVEAARHILDQNRQFNEEIGKYILICLLYLVLQTHGNPTAELLTEDAVTMCLLDMAQHTAKDIPTVNPTLRLSKVFYINNPVLSLDAYESNISINIIDFESLRAITTSSNLPNQLIREAEKYAIQQITDYCNSLMGLKDPITTHKDAPKFPLLICIRRQGVRFT